MVERYLYDPYGKATVCNGSWTPREGNASAYSNEILFTGHRLDPESGLYITLHRHYHPTLGRWMQRDPQGYVDGMSLYEYVHSSPLTKFDPDGTEFHIVEGDWERSKDKPQYTPKTDTVKKPDGKTEEVERVKQYVDSAKQMSHTLKEISDDEFNALKKAGKVEYDGKPFEGARQDLINKADREAKSTWEVQNSGGPEALRKKADELKAKNTQPEDSTGIGVHGFQGSENVLINLEKAPRKETMNELGERKDAKGAVVTANCYQEKSVQQGIEFYGGKMRVVSPQGQVESITVNPARVKSVTKQRETQGSSQQGQ